MPPLEAPGRASRRVLLALAASLLILGCKGSPTTSQSPAPTPTPATDNDTDATDSALSGSVMPGIKF